MGAKAILICDDKIVTLLRDDIPGIVWPGYWDLPGGGLEPGETPEHALWREIHEELGLDLTGSPFVWQADYPRDDGGHSYFYAAQISRNDVKAIRLGDEGQDWAMMTPRAFVDHPKAVTHFRTRVATCFDAIGWP